MSKSDILEKAVENTCLLLAGLLFQHRIEESTIQLYLRAFKAEQILEAWIKTAEREKWEILKTYSFCSTSGVLGPKRKEGDLQIPEGIYYIDRFNPKSKFHLSLGLNYPNASDRILGDPKKPGSDIFIHGGCQTVGCIPITDARIEEVYTMAKWAKANGQTPIAVHLYPFRFSSSSWSEHGHQNPQHHSLWKQLEAVFIFFEKERRLPVVAVAGNGDYLID